MGHDRHWAWASLLALCVAPALGACGNVEAALLGELRSEEQVELRVQPQMLGIDAFELEGGQRYVAKAGEFSFMPWGGAVDALEALKAKGYVVKTPTSLPQGFGSSFDAFEITEKGAKYIQPDAFGVGLEVHIGKKMAKEVLEYTEPSKNGPAVTQAHFRYDVSFNDFVDDLGIERELEAEIARAWPGEGMAVFSKTNKGWRLEQALWQ